MTLRRVPSRWFVPLLLVVLILPQGLFAQQDKQDKVAALKQSLAANQKQLKQYKWVETTVISLKGRRSPASRSSASTGLTGRSRNSN